MVGAGLIFLLSGSQATEVLHYNLSQSKNVVKLLFMYVQSWLLRYQLLRFELWDHKVLTKVLDNYALLQILDCASQMIFIPSRIG